MQDLKKGLNRGKCFYKQCPASIGFLLNESSLSFFGYTMINLDKLEFFLNAINLNE
jgi:hypothetical protein